MRMVVMQLPTGTHTYFPRAHRQQANTHRASMTCGHTEDSIRKQVRMSQFIIGSTRYVMYPSSTHERYVSNMGAGRRPTSILLTIADLGFVPTSPDLGRYLDISLVRYLGKDAEYSQREGAAGYSMSTRHNSREPNTHWDPPKRPNIIPDHRNEYGGFFFFTRASSNSALAVAPDARVRVWKVSRWPGGGQQRPGWKCWILMPVDRAASLAFSLAKVHNG